MAVGAEDLLRIAGNGRVGGPWGDGGLATKARLNLAWGMVADAAGNLVIAESGRRGVRVVAESTGMFYGRAMTAGHIYTVAGDGRSQSGEGGLAARAVFSVMAGVAAGTAGNVVTLTGGSAWLVAGSTGTFFGRAMTAGHIYAIDRTTGYVGYDGNVAFDAAGNVLFALPGGAVVQVVANQSGTFYGQPMTAGHSYVIAGNGRTGFSGDGGPATAAELDSPAGMATDAAGNLLICDGGNNRLRVVAGATGTFYGQPMTAGDIYTIAGTGKKGFSGDGGPATSAELDTPAAITTDAGNVLIADQGNGRIREISG